MSTATRWDGWYSSCGVAPAARRPKHRSPAGTVPERTPIMQRAPRGPKWAPKNEVDLSVLSGRKIMKGFMMMCVSGLALWVYFGQVASSSRLAAFDTSRDPAQPRQAVRSFQFQEFEDPVEMLVPRQPRTASEDERIDALAWFATGRIRQHRGDFPGALDAYQKALERDPLAVPVYRVLIPLAIEMRRNDEAAKWAVKAVELIPGDQQLLMQAAALLINRDDLPGAIRVLEKAAKSPGIDRHSAQYVNIMRDLAVLNMAVERPNVAAAAAAFEVVFDALVKPEEYKLDFRTRAQLQSNEATSFERMGKVFLDAKKT